MSMYKKYGLRPRIREWRDKIASEYNIRELLFFGDFSNPGMRGEIPRIREVTNLVIETQNTSPHYKKDFTDFIMLDYIYQKALVSADNGVGTFIIFTGDGHFSSVVKFLVDKCEKKVIIYAVREGLSGMLKNVASKCIELPEDGEPERTYYSMICYQANELQKRFGENTDKAPSFSSVINTVSEVYGMDRETVKDIANTMADRGYLNIRIRRVAYGRHISTVSVNNEKLNSDGIRLITDTSLFVLPQKNDKKTQETQITEKQKQR